jgi:methionyl aminopeptidase
MKSNFKEIIMISPLSEMLKTLGDMVTPGVTGKFIDSFATNLCKLHDVKPAFLGYKPPNFGGKEGFPNTICVSINDEVIHGIPSDRKFEEGDVVKLDMGIEKDGEFDDGAITVLCGIVDDKGRIQGCSATARKLVAATKEALAAGVQQAKAGNTTHDIAKAVELVAKNHDLHVVHGYGGHGIGNQLHMEPHIPNEEDGSIPKKLESGTRVAIEPMLATNHGFTYVATDGWTVKLRNGGLAAHFEQTVEIK